MAGSDRRRAATKTKGLAWRGLVALLGSLPALIPAAAAGQHSSQVRTELFSTAAACIGCHSGLVTPGGEDISIGFAWRASMMANSARDPYWQAAVRREVMDFPESREAIENECSRCHMPMANVAAVAAGRLGEVFANLRADSDNPLASLAHDGVSCTVCHQVQEDNLGRPESFTGRFMIDLEHSGEGRPLFGPFDVDSGRTTVMQSATAFRPTEASHIERSEMCATCHTLYTHALGAGGNGVQLPEQMPYLEWLNSDFREARSCQSCHMPVVADSAAISSVLGQPRSVVSRHVFLGGNFFMLRMLNRYRDDLGVTALPQELEASARRTEANLQSNTATIAVQGSRFLDGRLETVIAVRNLAGHKLPTAYPSRRAWIELIVRDRAGRVVFSSGALRPDGSIFGNDNDRDASEFEPHYNQIRSPEEVQIYESVMAGPDRRVTTGLLTAVGYLKDNRILPQGFDKAGAAADVAVHGDASADADFTGGGDDVLYSLDVREDARPFRIEAALWYQPIGRRWAENLRAYDAPETNRFVAYYASMAEASAIVLARVVATVP